MSEDCLILVNYHDEQIGQEYKLETHRKGLLHRAFSVFLYDDNRLLIQKRAAGKYHSAGLWANTCCSHPRVGEELEDAVGRRLLEEAGVVCPVQHLTSFVYRESFGELSEYELDHIFVGEYGGDFVCNHDEAEEMKYVDMDELASDMVQNPQKYAAWFLTAFPMVYHHLAVHGKK
jgi:isopentenyl-diphosphate delta-isomerase